MKDSRILPEINELLADVEELLMVYDRVERGAVLFFWFLTYKEKVSSEKCPALRAENIKNRPLKRSVLYSHNPKFSV